MNEDQQHFIEFLVGCEALRFGSFTTAAGRHSPYFIDTGRFDDGARLGAVAGWYARTLHAHLADAFDLLFGPAYKGIPLAAATAVELRRSFGHTVGFCFDRKEPKDHGEGGVLVGRQPRDGDRVVIVEDVVSAGGSVRRSVEQLRAAADLSIVGLVVSVDRMERGRGDATALDELGDELGVPTFPVVTVADVLAHLRGREIGGRVVLDDAAAERMLAYLREYGPR
jgi:orotate phosphoribosyltransferase